MPITANRSFKMIKTSAKARITEINDVARTIIGDYKSDAALAKLPILPGIMGELEEKNERFTLSINKDKITSEIDSADAKRDAAIRDLGTYLSGLAVVKNAEKKANALTLKSIFDKYGKKMTSANNEEESSLVSSMLKDFESEAAKKAIAETDEVGELIDDVEAAQKEFDEASKSYRDYKVNKADNASDLKKEVLKIINMRLVPFLTSVENDESYAVFAKKVEQIIDKVNDLVLARGKK